MRFMEIANAEDQLALWRLISDKMWGAFAQQLPQTTTTPMQSSSVDQSRAAQPTKPMAKHVPKAPAKTAHKSQPKPNPQQVASTQATKQQAQQHQQLAKHLHKELMKPNPQQKIYPQPPTPIQKPVIPIEPMTNGYDERDKDELVMHSRAQHPFKTISQTKSALSGQKRGF